MDSRPVVKALRASFHILCAEAEVKSLLPVAPTLEASFSLQQLEQTYTRARLAIDKLARV